MFGLAGVGLVEPRARERAEMLGAELADSGAVRRERLEAGAFALAASPLFVPVAPREAEHTPRTGVEPRDPFSGVERTADVAIDFAGGAGALDVEGRSAVIARSHDDQARTRRTRDPLP